MALTPPSHVAQGFVPAAVPPNAHFPNIRAFQDYFESFDVLQIKPGHRLIISDIRPLAPIKKNYYELGAVVQSVGQDLVDALNKCIAPIGKSFTIQILHNQDVKYIIGIGLEATFPKGGLLIARKGEKLVIRVSDLFQVMVQTNRMDLKIEPGRKLLFSGLKKDMLKEGFSVQALLKSFSLPGFNVNLVLQGVSAMLRGCEDEPEDRAIELDPGINGLIEVSISENTTYIFDATGFVERMRLQPKLTIPPGKKLQIVGDFVYQASDIWNKELTISIGFVKFLLDHLFLPFQKEVKISPCSFKLEDGLIEIFLESRSVNIEIVELSKQKPLFIDLFLLGKQMVQCDQTSITVRPEQSMVLLGLTPTEKIAMSGGPLIKIFSPDVGNTVSKKSPTGFYWHFRFVDASPIKREIGANHRCLVLSSEENFTLSLEPTPHVATFALGILSDSDPSLKNALLENDQQAIFYFLFKSIFHFCWQNFDYYENKSIPSYFKESTKKAIKDFMVDPTFVHHRITIFKEAELLFLMDGLPQLTAEEFGRLKANLNPSMAAIINAIKTISALELEGSYLKETIEAVRFQPILSALGQI